METDTPETDDFFCNPPGNEAAYEFAKKLERQRDSALRGWSDSGTEYACLSLDLEQAKARESKLLECLIHLVDRDWYQEGLTGLVTCTLAADQVRIAIRESLENAESIHPESKP